MVEYRAHFMGVFRFDGIGIVPEIKAVDVFVVEPESGVMGMVHAFAWARLKRKTARDDRAACGANRVENRLLKSRRPNIGSEWLSINCDINFACGFVYRKFYVILRPSSGGNKSNDERGYASSCDEKSRSNQAHDYALPPITTSCFASSNVM